MTKHRKSINVSKGDNEDAEFQKRSEARGNNELVEDENMTEIAYTV